jgi:hypothetical protein
MQKYLDQLLADIATAIASAPSSEKNVNWWIWLSMKEEDDIAPVQQLEDLTGIDKEMLPPATMLNDKQLNELLIALNKMLDAFNCHFVLQIKVPHRIQYECIREMFNQEVKVRQWHMGFFDLCRQDTEHKKCSLGEYCQCELFHELFKNFVEEDLSPEQERAKALVQEVQHLKRKHGNDWMKYYPYHLDADYDKENGNPYDYGMSDRDDEEDEDDWWKR